MSAVALFACLVAACGPQNNHHENVARGGRHGIRMVCGADIDKFCANADRKRRCLKDNLDKLSQACKDALAQQRRRGNDNDRNGDD